jgi:hypothetical protein
VAAGPSRQLGLSPRRTNTSTLRGPRAPTREVWTPTGRLVPFLVHASRPGEVGPRSVDVQRQACGHGSPLSFSVRPGGDKSPTISVRIAGLGARNAIQHGSGTQRHRSHRQTRRPGHPDTHRPGHPVTRIPSGPDTRRPGYPAARTPGRTQRPGHPVTRIPSGPDTRRPGGPGDPACTPRRPGHPGDPDTWPSQPARPAAPGSPPPGATGPGLLSRGRGRRYDGACSSMISRLAAVWRVRRAPRSPRSPLR